MPGEGNIRGFVDSSQRGADAMVSSSTEFVADKVLFGRNGKLQVGLHDEVQLVMASNTLLRNMIILWNYLFLSDYC